MSSFNVYIRVMFVIGSFLTIPPSAYRTRFDKSVDLEGDSEIDVDSISNTSYINDEAECAEVHFHVEASDYTLLQSLYPYEHLLTPRGMWKAFDGIMPTSFETDPKLMDKILDSLNAMNPIMTSSEKQIVLGRLFTFS